MSTDLFDRYAALDPAEAPEAIPDWTAITPVLLAAINEGTGEMQTQKTTPPTSHTTSKRRGWVVAAAAFAAVILTVGAAFLLTRASDPGEPEPANVPETPTTSVAPDTTQATVTTAPSVAESEDTAVLEAEALQIAERALAAYGSGDVDGFFADFSPNATLDVASVTEPGVRDEYAFWVELGPEITGQRCEVKAETLDFTGGVLDTPRFVVGCQTQIQDALTGPAGIVFNGTYQFTVEDGLVIEHQIIIPVEERADLALSEESARDTLGDDIADWLKVAHPDVWTNSLALAEPCAFEFNCRPSIIRREEGSPGPAPGEWFRSAATAATLLDHVTEFIAGSEDYPLDQ